MAADPSVCPVLSPPWRFAPCQIEQEAARDATLIFEATATRRKSLPRAKTQAQGPLGVV